MNLPVFLHGFTFYNTKKLDNNLKIYVHSRGGLLKDRTIEISSHQFTGNYNAGANNDNTCTDIALICIFNFGINYFNLTGGTPAEIQFDINVIVSHISNKNETKNFMNIITKNFGVSRKPSNILKFLMKVLIYLEFC